MMWSPDKGGTHNSQRGERTMTTLNTPAAAMIKMHGRKTRDLINDFILTGIMIDTQKKNVDPNMFTVRGWLMDEIERRNPEAFEKWIDSDKDDDGLLEYFHC
jgi:hypothetical protein